MRVKNTLNMVIMETAFNLRYTFLPNEVVEFDDKVGEALLLEGNGRLKKVEDEVIPEKEEEEDDE